MNSVHSVSSDGSINVLSILSRYTLPRSEPVLEQDSYTARQLRELTPGQLNRKTRVLLIGNVINKWAVTKPSTTAHYDIDDGQGSEWKRQWKKEWKNRFALLNYLEIFTDIGATTWNIEVLNRINSYPNILLNPVLHRNLNDLSKHFNQEELDDDEDEDDDYLSVTSRNPFDDPSMSYQNLTSLSLNIDTGHSLDLKSYKTPAAILVQPATGQTRQKLQHILDHAVITPIVVNGDTVSSRNSFNNGVGDWRSNIERLISPSILSERASQLSQSPKKDFFSRRLSETLQTIIQNDNQSLSQSPSKRKPSISSTRASFFQRLKTRSPSIKDSIASLQDSDQNSDTVPEPAQIPPQRYSHSILEALEDEDEDEVSYRHASVQTNVTESSDASFVTAHEIETNESGVYEDANSFASYHDVMSTYGSENIDNVEDIINDQLIDGKNHLIQNFKIIFSTLLT